MKGVITTVAQILALENGATLTITPGVACDRTNPVLVRMARELSQRLEPAGIDLLALSLTGETLVARIDEQRAEEPLCPNALGRMVRDLSYRLSGQVLEARIEDYAGDQAGFGGVSAETYSSGVGPASKPEAATVMAGRTFRSLWTRIWQESRN